MRRSGEAKTGGRIEHTVHYETFDSRINRGESKGQGKSNRLKYKAIRARNGSPQRERRKARLMTLKV